jgi:hypothetical protein
LVTRELQKKMENINNVIINKQTFNDNDVTLAATHSIAENARRIFSFFATAVGPRGEKGHSTPMSALLNAFRAAIKMGCRCPVGQGDRIRYNSAREGES